MYKFASKFFAHFWINNKCFQQIYDKKILPKISHTNSRQNAYFILCFVLASIFEVQNNAIQYKNARFRFMMTYFYFESAESVANNSQRAFHVPFEALSCGDRSFSNLSSEMRASRTHFSSVIQPRYIDIMSIRQFVWCGSVRSRLLHVLYSTVARKC